MNVGVAGHAGAPEVAKNRTLNPESTMKLI